MDSSQKFSRYSAWGAVLTASDDQTVKVDEVLKSGIAVARELRNGTRIVRIIGSHEYNNFDVKTPQQMLEAINRGHLWERFTVYYKTPGDEQVKGRSVTPAWEPMLTAIFAKNGEWAAWNPNGYYNASPLGDKMFGWQLYSTTQEKGQPEFFRSDQYRENFEKQGAIEKLLEVGNIEDALTAAELSASKMIVSNTTDLPGEKLAETASTTTTVKKDTDNLGAKIAINEDVVVKDSTEKLGNIKPKQNDSSDIEETASKEGGKDTSEKTVSNDQQPAATFLADHALIAKQSPKVRITSPKNEDDVRKEQLNLQVQIALPKSCLLYTSPSPRDKRQSRMPSSA